MSYWQLQRFLWFEFLTFPFLWLGGAVVFLCTGWIYAIMWVTRQIVRATYPSSYEMEEQTQLVEGGEFEI